VKKNIIFVVIASFICIFSLPASGRNLQKIYPIDSDVYEAISALYISQGLALPSTTGPWSADELLNMLENIDIARLSGGLLTTYQYASSELNSSADTVKFGLGASIETYWHSNTTDFLDESDWVVGFEDGTCSRTS